MQTLLTELIDSLIALPQEIASVALADPVSLVLVVVGSLLFGVSFALFGYLTLGAVVELLVPDLSGQSPPPEAR